MPIDQFIEELAAAGVYLAVRDGKLVCKASEGALTPEWRERIAGRREECIAFLDKAGAHGGGSDPALKRREQGPAPLSPTQQRLWFVDRLTESSVNYAIPVMHRLEGALDVTALERAMGRIIVRHESLRSMIVMQDDAPVAQVRDVPDFAFVRHDLGSLEPGNREPAVLERLNALMAKPFDLSSEIPVRAELFQLGPRTHVVLLLLHHVASDGWSVENLLRELSLLYAAFSEGRQDPLEPLSVQYADYAAWLGKWLKGERLETALAYWRSRLAGAPAAHDLPLDRPRPGHPLRQGASWRHQIPRSLRQDLIELGRSRSATLFMTMQAAFAVLISRWSGSRDVLVGTPVANRPRPELAPLIGFFANTLVLRLQFEGNPAFEEVLDLARSTALDAYDHQYLPFDVLVEALNPPRNLNLAPVFQIMFSLQDIDEDGALDLPGIVASAVVPDAVNAKFDISLSLTQSDDGMTACWDYSSELFDAGTIASLARSYEALLWGIVANPMRRIDQLSLQDEEDEAATIALGTGSVCSGEHDACLHALVERQAMRGPEAPALVHGGGTLSYAELNRRANRLAHHLRRQGVGPESRVAVMMARGPGLVSGILAVLKAGAAYVPMEPDLPVQRLRHLLSDSEPQAILHDASARVVLEGLHPEMDADIPSPVRIDIDAGHPVWDNEIDTDPSPPDTGVCPDHPAYVIYTSGSTGRPKGVTVTHRAVVNRLRWLQASYPCDHRDRVLQKTPIGFDVSVREMFSTLMAGACLVQADPEGHKDPSYLIDLIDHEQVTVVSFVPSMLQVFLDQTGLERCRSLRRIYSGGEALSVHLVERCRRALPHASLHNFYGPTETAINVTAWDAPREACPDTVPIGRPGSNTRLYILDATGRPVPRGMRGEIHVAGIQLARGYLHRADLTSERFVPDPYSPVPGARMYRTGDIGRFRTDGQIDYLGRIDNQVKIRGQRVELGEIEAHLSADPSVDAAVVRLRPDDTGGLTLAAYLVLHDDKDPPDTLVASLRRRLKAHLPAHMQPCDYMILGQLPVTANGKLDEAALPAPDRHDGLSPAHAPPATPLEAQLAAWWETLLGRGPVGATANFFDLGGHSLLLTRLHNRICAERGIEFPLKRLFEAQTVRDQATLLASLPSLESRTPPSVPVPRPASAPAVLSFAQQRLWFIDQMGGPHGVYNIPCALRLEGHLQPDALQRALESIVRRHDVLRTVFESDAGEAHPKLLGDVGMQLPLRDLADIPPGSREDAIRACMRAEVEQPFDLASELVVRAKLLRLSEQEHVLLLTLHHIAADGWSMTVLLQELAELYEADVEGRACALPPMTLQYADYAHWQRAWLQGERLESQLSYWESQLDGLPAVHNLPLDFPRPEQQRHRGALHYQHLSRSVLDGLARMARAHDATLFMVLQAAFAVLLARWSGESDIVMGTPIANRRHEALAPLIGFFVNALVLRHDLSGNPGFSDVLEHARTIALDAYQHQDLPFEMLVDHLRPRRSLAHTPLFQVMLSLGNNREAIVPFGGLSVSDVAGDAGVHYAKYDITLNLRETACGLEAVWDYNLDLFRTDTITRIATSFEALLRDIVENPTKGVQQLALLGTDEQPRRMEHGPVLALPDSVGVHVQVAAWARDTPRALAVSDGSRRIDYATLNRRANQVAHALIALGVGPDQTVAIHTERSLETVIGILAVLKAGGAYVPLDPAHPIARLNGMLDDCAATAILTQRGLRQMLAGSDVTSLALDDEEGFERFDTSEPVVAQLRSDHLAYVIYTSGSTGVPKGVMIEHKALLNMVESCRAYLSDEQAIASAWWASVGFDVSVFEILTPLVMGGAVHVVPDPIRIDVPAYIQWLARERITQAFMAPFIVRRLRDLPDNEIAGLSLRCLWTGVEPLRENELYRIGKLLPALRLVNSYGPTEATFYCTCYDGIGDRSRIAPIGRPMANARIQVLDGAMQPVPDGVVGEVFISGACIGRGYLNQPERTAERFLTDGAGARMYRTGDMARWTGDGQLVFRGRRDHQVKLNGVRIELGEVEATLAAHPDVIDTAVCVRAGQGTDTSRLVAYVVAHNRGELSLDSLREHMARRLPPYMLPSAYVALDSLPLTVNGKLDARALPGPASDALDSDTHAPPAEGLEQLLAVIWQDVLDIEQVSTTANFFDLGGHSLKAVLLMTRLREAIGRALPISTLFRAPTIRALAAHIEERIPQAEDTLVRLRDGDRYQRLFVFHAAGGDVLCYQPLLRHLDPGLAVVGLHRSELAHQRVPAFHSIEALADSYTRRLREEQPLGPYVLAGWSSGGLLALEVAARLEACGQEVAVVMLVDSMLAMGTELPVRLREAGLEALTQLDPQAACAQMREFDPELPEVVPQGGHLSIAASDYFNYMVAANRIAIEFHRPSFQLRAPVHYFGCSINLGSTTQTERVAGIQTLVRAPITQESFASSHFSIMEEPAAASLGQAMNRVIERHADVGPDQAGTDQTPINRIQGTLA